MMPVLVMPARYACPRYATLVMPVLVMPTMPCLTVFVTNSRNKRPALVPRFIATLLLTSLLLCSPLTAAESAPNYRLQLFFGLSKPNGGGVSLKEWRAFESLQITRFFEGFNVIDSTGYYQGEAERSKVVTIFTTESNLTTTQTKAAELSQWYASHFGQDSVMMVTSELTNWKFIGKK